MYGLGFVKVCAITPKLLVGNPQYNVEEMLKALKNNSASIAAFPELGVTGYTCNDLFFQRTILDEALAALTYFLENNTFKGVVIVGCPIDVEGALFNAAVVIQKNKILGIVPKKFLPNTEEFYEKRWFKSGTDLQINMINLFGQEIPFGDMIFIEKNNRVLRFGIEICEDMWAPVSPGNLLSIHGANLIVNLSASNETLGKDSIRRHAVLDHSRRNGGAYLYASAGVSESTSETVFSGHNIIASLGEMIVETENFCRDTEVLYGDLDIEKINFKRLKNSSLRDTLHQGNFVYQTVEFSLDIAKDFSFEKSFNSLPFVPSDDKSFLKIAALQEYGLLKRLEHIGTQRVIIGVSGGLDSTLALLIAHQAFVRLKWDPKGIIAVTMPGMGTSVRTKNNATEMMSFLGVTVLEKDIREAVKEHFKLIDHDETIKDLTYENAQARMRTMILMDLATKYQGFVLGTGDMSELALGWCTYNGDQMSMYGINAGLPKTMVRYMIQKYAEIKYPKLAKTLLDIVATPISPELTDENQKTEDFLGKYEVNDFILYRFLACGDSENRIVALLQRAFTLSFEESNQAVVRFFHRFYSQQFKRQALPDGPKVLDISLAPRGDFRMPSDVKR